MKVTEHAARPDGRRQEAPTDVSGCARAEVIPEDISAWNGLTVIGSSSQTFQGNVRQAAAVRSFVRSEFAGHAVIDDAVTAASELAANAILHTASGRDGGTFKVFLGVLSRASVCLLMTDDGAPGTPTPRAASADAESGRGLDIVTQISSVFIPIRQAELKGVFVVITAAPENSDRIRSSATT